MGGERRTCGVDPVIAWLNEVPYDCREALATVRRHTPEYKGAEALQSAVVGHLDEAHRELARNEFLDIGSAEEAARLASLIVESIDTLSETKREIGLLAVAYFVSTDDAEDDFSSPVGFDDDLQVLRSACQHLGISID